jgi:NTP pyrophosphatase (non-canonical NTP hydrolase)
MGFNPTSKGNVPAKLMCITCELDEVERAMEAEFVSVAEERASVAEELADVAMYALLGAFDLRGSVALRSVTYVPNIYACPSELTKPARRYVVMAMEKWRRHEFGDVAMCFELIVLEVMRLAEAHGFDLETHIQLKIEKNLEREHLNGGKHPDS